MAEYIDSLVAADLKDKADWRPVRRLLRKNRLTEFLQRWGYSIVSFSTVYYNADLTQADFYFSKWWYLNLFESTVMGSTSFETRNCLVEASDSCPTKVRRRWSAV